jgi:hypothetical protein
MKLTIESTDLVVELVHPETHCAMRCRVWEGETDGGVKVHVFIPRVAAKADQDLSQFERELTECRPASPEIAGIPLRLVL